MIVRDFVPADADRFGVPYAVYLKDLAERTC